MKFVSTRGGIRDVSFEEGIFMGYTTDGGFLMPEVIPELDVETLKSWKDLSYVDLCVKILSLFISESEINKSELKDIVVKAYGNDFMCPVPKITDDLYLLELFHGKTKAFKDIPMVLLRQFLDFFLQKQNKHITLLVGTSGDTGSAAIESVRNSKCIDIIVLFPVGYCNKVQELQMTTVLDDNVHVFAVEGTNDDLDVVVKACSVDKDLVDKYNLGSMSSINIGRLLTQIVYYFYAYFKVCKTVGEQIKFVVPTGGMGNITAGSIASKMGLPVSLQAAVNDNNNVFKALTTGRFSKHEIIKTWSTAMDIQVAYNIERILFLFSNSNAALVDSLMKEFDEKGTVNFPLELIKNIGKTITPDWVSKDKVLATMKHTWKTNNYILCPHTAVGVTVGLQNRSEGNDNIPTVCIATASPAKFIEAVKAADIEYTPPSEITDLENMTTRYEDMKKGDDWEDILRKKIISIG